MRCFHWLTILGLTKLFKIIKNLCNNNQIKMKNRFNKECLLLDGRLLVSWLTLKFKNLENY